MAVLKTISLFLLLVGLVVAPALGLAQTPASVELPVEWKVGEKHKFEMTKSREDARVGRRRSATSGESTTPFEIEVLQETEDGYVIRWTNGRTRFSRRNRNQLTDKMANLGAGVPFDIRTNIYGGVEELLNVDAVGALFEEAVDVILQWLENNGQPQATIAQVRSIFSSMMSNPATIQLFALREPPGFFMTFGGFYELGEPLEYEDLLANLWGKNRSQQRHFSCCGRWAPAGKQQR